MRIENMETFQNRKMKTMPYDRDESQRKVDSDCDYQGAGFKNRPDVITDLCLQTKQLEAKVTVGKGVAQ
jgi:hypothetical protein